MVQYFLDTF
jgi:hypothetical protein